MEILLPGVALELYRLCQTVENQCELDVLKSSIALRTGIKCYKVCPEGILSLLYFKNRFLLFYVFILSLNLTLIEAISHCI